MKHREAWLCALVLILLAAAPLQSQSVPSPGVIRFQWGLVAGLEGTGPFMARVERQGGSQGTVSVRYTLRSNAAREGEDFLPFTGTVTFADGDSNPKTLMIPVLDDLVPEKTETLLLTLSEPTGGAKLGVPARAQIEIRDDDTPSPLLGAATAPIEIEADHGPIYPQLRSPAVTALAGGGFVVVWSDWADRFLLIPYAGNRLYDVNGQLVTGSLWISNGALGMKVAAQPGGGFTVTGDAYNIISTFHIESLGTYGRRFDGAGGPLTPYLQLPFLPSATAAGKNGGLLTLSGNPKVLLSRFGRLGQPLGSPLVVTRSGQAAVLASDAQGRGIVAWLNKSGGANRLFVRRMDTEGRWMAPPFAVDPMLDRRPGAITLAAAPDGRFVVVWEGSSDGDGLGIFGRRFTAAGEPAGPVFQVNSETTGDQTQPQVAVQGDGRFLVIWQGASNVHGQYFAADGSLLGREELMTGEAESYGAVLAGDPAGHYTVVWKSVMPPLSRGAITARRFMMP